MTAAVRPAPVSVVIPCYRCGSTIGRAISSVARQTWPPREVILVDDESGDGTVSVLQELRRSHAPDWIRVISLGRNGGPAAARNAGWDAATQPLIAFLDADDSWHPDKLAIQHRLMASSPAYALTGHPCRVLEDDRSGCAAAADTPRVDLGESEIRPVSRRHLLLGNRFSTSGVMLRRDLPHRFADGKRRSEDYLLWLQICLAGYPVGGISPVLGFHHKAVYGSGGLSENLWAMELGELDTYRRLRAASQITGAVHGALSVYSLLRHTRRLMTATWRPRARHAA
jgi:glycosyltransferase involved in cell wall biosynthesis